METKVFFFLNQFHVISHKNSLLEVQEYYCSILVEIDTNLDFFKNKKESLYIIYMFILEVQEKLIEGSSHVIYVTFVIRRN